jgi:hypothetical protein
MKILLKQKIYSNQVFKLLCSLQDKSQQYLLILSQVLLPLYVVVLTTAIVYQCGLLNCDLELDQNPVIVAFSLIRCAKALDILKAVCPCLDGIINVILFYWSVKICTCTQRDKNTDVRLGVPRWVFVEVIFVEVGRLLMNPLRLRSKSCHHTNGAGMPRHKCPVHAFVVWSACTISG